MAHQSRTPSIKLTLENELFNLLLSAIDKNINVNIESENFSKIAERLKNKLLTYSVPRVNEEGVSFVDIRFFPNEASDMIWQLLIQTPRKEDMKDYYSILKENYDAKRN